MATEAVGIAMSSVGRGRRGFIATIAPVRTGKANQREARDAT